MLEQARELAKNGRYSESRQLALAAANAGAGNGAVKFLEQLNDPDRFEPALSPAQGATLTALEGHLQRGYSAYNLGDYANAFTAFQDAIRLDPYNSAARLGMERAEARRSEYFDAARDHTRARMLNEVNREFENIDRLNSFTASGVLPGHGTVTPAQSPPGMAPQMAIAGGVVSMVPAAPAPVVPFAPAATPQPAPDLVNGIVGGRAATTPGQMNPPVTGVVGDKQVLPWALADAKGVGDFDTGIAGAMEGPLTPQLKTVGRVSLPVEVPLAGTVFYFSKVKDHAALDVKVVKPWSAAERTAFWALVVGLALGWLARAAYIKGWVARRPSMPQLSSSTPRCSPTTGRSTSSLTST